jgi:hypothetical protein
MKVTTNRILILFGIIALAIMACLPVSIFAMPLLGQGQPSQADPAGTLQAMVSQTTVAMTQNASSPKPTLSVLPSVTPIPATSTPPPTATAVRYCDWVSFIKDVTLPDGTVLRPGDIFTKTWRLQNRGTCTWTSDYFLVFTSGVPMGGTTAVRLPGNVAPGQYVDVSVTLTAPDSQGRQVGYWMLRNPSGALFGYGDKAEQAFYVDIKVVKDRQQRGTVTGRLSYPSEFIPGMRVALFSLSDGKAYFVDTAYGQGSYSIDVPAGSYYIVSYPYQGVPGRTGQVDSYSYGPGSFAGGYSLAVLCGLTVECNDHSLIAVNVAVGQTVAADPTDWYAPDGIELVMPNP